VPARIDILAVGSLHRDLQPAFDHYRRLLAGSVDFGVREVREVALRGRSPAEVMREEARRLFAAWPQNGLVVALDTAGRSYDSLAFARRLEAWLARSPLTFVMGGSLGLADEVGERVHDSLSLSPLTLPHQLARVVLAEQLFRGLKIARREKYHH
jgi:23S rRNA (pseudouridine1915-N3)-methyltransferase